MPNPFPFLSSYLPAQSVIGGHSGVTIIPLLSQAKPAVPESVTGDKATLDALVNRIQFGGDGSSLFFLTFSRLPIRLAFSSLHK